MTSPNPWLNLIEVPEAYSGAQSRTSFTKHWGQKKSYEGEETLHRPILLESDEGTPTEKYFAADVESETKPDESNWIVVILSDPTSGDVTRYAFYPGRFQIRPQYELVAWGQSIASECPWIQDFDRDFGSESSVKSLKRMFSEVSRLIENENFEQIDRILRLADPHKYNLDFATGLLRAAFIYRSRLPSWNLWLRETEDYLTEAGEDAEAELAGLK